MMNSCEESKYKWKYDSAFFYYKIGIAEKAPDSP